MVQDCEDMSVCGSNCVGDGNGLTNFDSTRVLPINNFGKNFLRFSVCDLGVDEDVLERFEVVRMKRCAEPAPGVKGEDAYKICPYWIPPSTFTALLIPLNSTYIRLEYANYVSGEIINGLNDSYYANVLTDPPPKEYYGTTEKFPSTIDIEYAETNYCNRNEECAGSYCDTKSVPNKCAPKAEKHFTTLTGNSFLAPPYSDD